RVSARRRCAGAPARQSGSARVGRFLADVGGTGGSPRPRAAGNRADQKTCRRGVGAPARAGSRRVELKLASTKLPLSSRPTPAKAGGEPGTSNPRMPETNGLVVYWVPAFAGTTPHD